MRTGFSPYNSKDNKYIGIITECLRSGGIDVYDYDKLKKHRNLENIEIVNLNWYESKIESRYIILKIIRMILRTIELLYLKANGIKIIYTM